MALAFVPKASIAAGLDTATATGSGGYWSNININAQSGTSGQNPTGTVAFSFGALNVSEPVTCLSVTGPDRGGGTVGSPTTAVMNTAPSPEAGGVVTVELVDNGGNGADVMSAQVLGRAPTDCSPVSNFVLTSTLTNGRAVVFDAPLVPTSRAQCMNGGWLNFPQFKNQGDCVSFVETGK